MEYGVPLWLWMVVHPRVYLAALRSEPIIYERFRFFTTLKVDIARRTGFGSVFSKLRLRGCLGMCAALSYNTVMFIHISVSLPLFLDVSGYGFGDGMMGWLEQCVSPVVRFGIIGEEYVVSSICTTVSHEYVHCALRQEFGRGPIGDEEWALEKIGL